MQRYIFFGLILLISWLTLTQGQGWAGQASCNRISDVEIRYKDYYPNYLGFNLTTQSVDTQGMFYSYIKVAVNECCHFMDVSFKKLNRTELEVVDLALVALGENYDEVPRPFVFYFPEFIASNDRVVYDYDLQFIKLERSSGQAVVMLTPESKKQVSMFYIFKESTPMLAMMLAMSWLVGILGWITVRTIPYTTPYRIIYHTIPYHTIPYHTIPYHTIPYHTVPYHTIPYHTIIYHTIPYCTIPYRAIPYRSIPYHTIYHTRPYHIMP